MSKTYLALVTIKLSVELEIPEGSSRTEIGTIAALEVKRISGKLSNDVSKVNILDEKGNFLFE